MRNDHFALFAKVRSDLLAAEQAHPDSPALKVLHASAGKALNGFSHMFTDEQYATLSGTPKTDDTQP